MNTKMTVGATVAGLVIVGGGAFFLSSLGTSETDGKSETLVATTTEEVTTSGARTEPTFTIGKTVPISVEAGTAFALFDESTITSTASYPTVTGISNVPKVGIIVNSSEDRGIVASWEIPVTDNHWSYSPSVMLKPGTYTLLLFIDQHLMQTAKLTVVQ